MARNSIKQSVNRRGQLKKALLWVAIGVGVFAVISGLLMWRFWAKHHNEPEVIGVSFSQVQAERYGSDWKANYSALLTDLKFKHLRIAAYWDRLEPHKGQYDFSELDWMVQQAGANGTKLTLVIGQKTLRYPECYYPSWLNRNDTTAVSTAAQAMTVKVVEHFRSNTTIEAWQVENEFLLHSFGECPAKNLTRAELNKEVGIVKRLDPTRPIVLTQSDQFGFPAIGPFGDYFGFSMYRWAYNKNFGYFRYPQPGAYNWLKAAWVEALTGQKVYIHELQAEAWGKTGNEYLPLSEQAKTMTPAQLRDNVQYARDTQIRRFDLWGAEWWYWLKTQKDQPAMWDEVKQLLN